MTRLTRRIAWMSVSGSPSIAIRSGRCRHRGPDLVVDPTRLGPPARAGQQRVARGHAEADERLQLDRHQPVHAVGAAREADAGGQVTRERLPGHPPSPAHLVHDHRTLTVSLLDAGRVHEDRERADEPHAALDHQRDVLVAGQEPVLDRAHAFFDREAQPGPAVGVRGSVRAGTVRLFDGRPNLLARVGARRRHRPGRADAAGDEDLHVVRAAPEVFPRAPPHFVHAVVAGERPAVAVVGGEPTPGDQQARPGDHPGLDGVAHLDIEEVLLAHDPHRRGPRGEIRSEIRSGGERAGARDRGRAGRADRPGPARSRRGCGSR